MRRALCDVLERLGADGATAFINGDSPEKVSDAIFAFVREEQDRIEVQRDNALTQLDTLNEVIGEVRGVCKADDDELTVVAVRRVARLAYAARLPRAKPPEVSPPVDKAIDCSACGPVLHRFRPSPDAGPFWRCSECAQVTEDEYGDPA